MKKVSFAALVVALTSTTFAATADNVPAHCPKAFQGFSLGGNVGLGTGNASQSAGIGAIDADGDVLAAIGNKNRLGVRGFDGGVNTGYTHRFGNFGLGLEFVANWTNVKGGTSFSDSNDDSFSHNLRLRNSLQLRGNFSYVIANLVAPKLIIGWDASKWQQQGRGTLVLPNTGESVTAGGKKSKYLNGLLVGAGVDFLATKHFIIGMDATVSLFKKHSFSAALPTSAATAAATNVVGVGVAGSTKIQPYTKISLVMKFIY